jgi:hypothetical protein
MKKTFYIFFIVSLFAATVSGQPATWSWAKYAGGTKLDGPRDMVNDKSGNIYMTGNFSSPTISFDSYQLTNTGSYDYFLAKYDETGKVQWVKGAIGSADNDEGWGIATDQSGNIYTTGSFSSPTIKFGSYTLTNTGESDIFIVKYSKTGNVIWAKKFGDTKYEAGLRIITDKDRNFYVSGIFRSTSFTLGKTTLTNDNSSTNRIFIAKFDSNGNVKWAKKAQGTGSDMPYDMTTDNKGHIYLTGSFDSSPLTLGSIVITNAGGTDIFVAEIDTNGTFGWAKSAGGASTDFPQGIALDSAGNVIVTGNFSSSSCTFSTVSLTCTGNADIFIVKYNSSGNTIWAKGATGTKGDWGYSVKTSTNGSIYVTGDFQSATLKLGNITLTNTSILQQEDLFCVKMDSNGNYLWALKSTGQGDESPVSLTVTESGIIYLSGTFTGTLAFFGSDTIINSSTSLSSWDLFIAKIVVCNLSAPTILPVGPISICPGDSISLTASSANSYLWSDNSKTKSITVLKAGNYTVTIYDNNGCSATSAPVNVTLFPKPTDPVITKIGNTLKSTLATTYQWYMNDSIIPGATSQIFSPVKNAYYKVEVTDNNGCAAISDTFNFVLTGIFNSSSDQEKMVVFPNPSNGDFTVSIPSMSGKIEVFNSMGKIVCSQYVEKQTNIKFNLTGKGIYYIRISTDNQILINKLILYR